MPDGTKCIFGSRNSGIPDAVEFFSTIHPINFSNPGLTPPNTFIASTWLLKSIIDVNGNIVTFNYKRKKPTCNKSYSASNYNIGTNISGCNDIGGTAFDRNKLSGVFQWPMYLTSIQSPIENINFACTDAVCNRYTIPELSYADLSDQHTISIDISLLGIDNWPNGSNPGCLNNLQWEKLNSIIITDNNHTNPVNNYSPNVIRQFNFNYVNTSNQRLLLGSLQALDKNSKVVNQYQFNYNSDFTTENNLLYNPDLPIYANGNFTDHWGFYNGYNLPSNGDFSSLKVPNPSLVTTELLNKITYPTGGYTVFTWESNDYSQVVSLTRNSLNSVNGFGGGCRIFEIQNFLANGTIASDKKYWYKNGYTAGLADPHTLLSSGVLNGNPKYQFQFSNRPGINGMTWGGTVNSMIGTGNFGYTGQGSPVGYKEVDEVNADGSYTKNFFTNYDADYNGVSHWDITPTGFLGWDPAVDNYFQRNSLELERGKLVATIAYNSSNVALHKTVYTYRSDPARFTYNTLNLIENTGFYRTDALVWAFYSSGVAGNTPPASAFACSSGGIALTTARTIYNYSYYPVLKTVTAWDQQGANPVVETTAYTYNPNNLLRSKTETSSKEESIVTNYTYPTDESDATSINMTNAHILTPIIQSSTTNNLIPVSLSRTNYYQPYTGIYVPQNIQTQVGNNTSEVREQINKYDSKGHPQEIQKVNDVKEVYLWGYNSQYIVADIKGSTYAAAIALVNQAILDEGNNGYTDAALRTELNKLRTGLPTALVTTYTYASGIGISSQTDPQGRTSYYEYDPFGQLQVIRDMNNNVIKKFDYKYQTFTHSSVVWQATGNLRCKPCPANSLYATNMQQHEEQDINPQSSTYNITRWVDDNIPGSCTIVPDWQIISTSCQLSGGINTGYQTVIKQDKNPCSSTYNQQQTTSVYNATACPIPPPSCSFSMWSGFSSPTNSISSSGTTVSFYLVFYAMGTTLSPGVSYTVATINGGCRPSVTRTLTLNASGRTWQVIIYSSGQMSVKLTSGTSVTPGTTINLSGSFSL